MQANDLEALLRSRIPIIVVDSRDEAQVLKGLMRACAPISASLAVARTAEAAPPRAGLPLFRWTVTDGLKRLDVEVGPPQRTVSEPLEILRHIRATTLAGVYALLDFHPYLHDPTIVRLLKDIAQDYGACARTGRGGGARMDARQSTPAGQDRCACPRAAGREHERADRGRHPAPGAQRD